MVWKSSEVCEKNMIRAFFVSKKYIWFAYGGALLLLMLLFAQVEMSVMINEWYGGFYDHLQQAESYVKENKSEEGISIFWINLLKFFKIAVPYVLIASFTNYVTRRYSLWWREAITFNYLPRWRKVTNEIEGASQRIQQDTERFSRIVESLGLQVVRAIMTLIAFLPILWGFSTLINVPFITGQSLEIINIIGNQTVINFIPGSLVWTSLLASLGGLAISWFVGSKLPGLEYNNQVVEAAFRKELVYGEDDKVNYCTIKTLIELFIGIKFNYKRLFLHYGYFDLWVVLFDQCMMIVPYVIAGPGLFMGLLSLGKMVQISNAFQKVHGGFSLFIHNWTTITELRSIWRRLKEFQDNLELQGH